MFELHIPNLDVSSGSIPVSWCIDQETLKYLKDNDLKNPMVVFIVSHKTGEDEHKEDRYIVPLSQLMTYIYFRYLGNNKIYAFISTSSSKKQVKNNFLEHWRGDYDNQVLSYDGESYREIITESSHYNTLYAQPLSVDVPKECFAKEPSAFEKAWVNWLFNFGDKATDQCSFRKRRLLSLVQIPVFMVNLLIRVFMLLISALFMFRGFSFKYLLHPLTYELGDTIAVWGEGSLFIRNDSSTLRLPNECTPLDLLKYVWKKCFILLLSPPFLLLYLYLYKHHHLLSSINMFSYIAIGVVAIVSIIQFYIKGYFYKIYNKFFTYSENEQDLGELICSPDKKPVSLNSLPRKKRTIRLRILDLKTKVCRPFQG